MSKRNNKAAGYVCFYLPECTILSVKGIKEVRNLPFVKMFCADNIKEGNVTSRLTNKGQRLGPIIIGENREDLENNITKIQQTIKITVKDRNENYHGIIWDMYYNHMIYNYLSLGAGWYKFNFCISNYSINHFHIIKKL